MPSQKVPAFLATQSVVNGIPELSVRNDNLNDGAALRVGMQFWTLCVRPTISC